MKKKLFLLHCVIFTSGKYLTKNARWEVFEECSGLGDEYFFYMVQGMMVKRFHKVTRTTTNFLVAHPLKSVFTVTTEICLKFSYDRFYETFPILLNELNTN